MTWEPESQNEPSFGQVNIGHGLGYLLVLCGLVVTIVILSQIRDLFVNPQQLIMFEELFPEQLTISWSDGRITMPAEVLAYALPLLLLSMAGGIASSLIQAGINLLRKRQATKTN